MIFRQVFDNKSSTYTYLIASAKGREAVIIDPVIENVESYIKLLQELDLKLVKVIDTHIHACLLYTSPSPRDGLLSRMPSSA